MNDKLGLAQREKYWNERDTEEKLDALREQVQQLTYQLGQVCGIVETLLHHSHADGKIVAPIEHRQRHETYIPNSLRVNHDK
jgi:DNA repair ATPase RecN